MGLYFYNAATLNISNKSIDRLAIERFAVYLSELILIIFPVSSFCLYTMTSRL
ncbi:hypothetical protein I4U23_019850 [Adineta vaga]|nr:hypothetical protein I4U23_019850 [Adineta vaga]